MNTILFPEGWSQKHKSFYNEVSTYQREGKNKHDCGPDVLSEVAMDIIKPKGLVTA
jgi:hypothetical protein